MVQNDDVDTIVAQATPAGYGGIGIVRVSGPKVSHIAEAVLKKSPTPKRAEYFTFVNRQGESLDEGIALYFKAPHSFTGEDVLELQGHGGPVVIQSILREIVSLGARLARPGEFSERAFLNNKIDLLQAEAISDLIHASSEQAARSALRSLQGEFSSEIESFLEELISLRMHVEARIDFPEEEIEELANQNLLSMLNHLTDRLQEIFKKAKTGVLISEGARVVILGRPNAGKSSLLNILAGYDAAIVTDIPGTTRDLLKEKINLDGLLLHLVDTAGLRSSDDVVEQEGIRRAIAELEKADHILLVVDGTSTKETNPYHLFPEWKSYFKENIPITVVYNKIDILDLSPSLKTNAGYTTLSLSVKTGAGMDMFLNHLKSSFQFSSQEEGTVVARTRHLEALKHVSNHLISAKKELEDKQSYELMAEELRLAQQYLGEITGKFTCDDLLGKIFSEFCIGK